ncbi:DNA replication/repair protein RecF [Leucobacter sp. CSA1]|uniref:DNA replication and repair protein RecF n=1 Tax=Leucobacter chromiisoli TaxID=2796471 RepID=A0A934Q6R0_9MICO|nr:DNA replication/repair protein RecF [Leucobacter chromiisoli]MBK0418736.1 DNA replication/repair protein RecF [Leucobacter chromiisoli]
MRVAHLSLADYRNYRAAELELQPGPNLLVGRNGQGKTNLVEAIGYFATLRSHRVTGDAALIRAGAEAAVARMRVEASGRDVLLELQLNRDRPNRAQVNRNAVRPRELTRWFRTVLFAPEDLTIVRGDPSGRRRFLDDALISRSPAAAGVIADYERVLRQRTSLLKSARGGGRAAVDATLDVWDAQLIEYGSWIMHARRGLVAELGEPLRRSYSVLVDQDHRPTIGLSESTTNTLRSDVSRETAADALDGGAAALVDVSRETIAEQFASALRAVRSQELDRGVTLVGPHRDDALFMLNGLPVKGYASHGESWSFILSLRLATALLLREESPGGDPVIILDDVFAELDSSRRRSLMAAVSEFEQVIVTAAVEGDVPDDVFWHRTYIDGGRVRTTPISEGGAE